MCPSLIPPGWDEWVVKWKYLRGMAASSLSSIIKQVSRITQHYMQFSNFHALFKPQLSAALNNSKGLMMILFSGFIGKKLKKNSVAFFSMQPVANYKTAKLLECNSHHYLFLLDWSLLPPGGKCSPRYSKPSVTWTNMDSSLSELCSILNYANVYSDCMVKVTATERPCSHARLRLANKYMCILDISSRYILLSWLTWSNEGTESTWVCHSETSQEIRV